MTKQYRVFTGLAALLVTYGISSAGAVQGLALHPDSEVTAMADVAPADSLPPAAAVPAGGAVSASVAQAIASPGTGEVAKVVVTVPAATNAVVEGGTDLVPVEAFPGAGKKDNLISVALDDVPLQDVVRLFTKVSGANIIASSTNLQGKVTVNLQDVEWKPALDSILDMYGMMVVEKVPGSGIYSVMTKAPGASEPLIALPIFLNYAPVSNVVATIKPMVGNDGMVSPFPNANAVIVRASAANLSEIRKVIQEIDVPRQQVYIEAKFLELTDEAIKDLGINWQVLEGYSVGVSTLSQTITDKRSTFNGNRTGLGTVDSNLRNDAASVSGTGIPGSGSTDSRTLKQTVQSSSSSTLSDSTKDGLASTVGNSAGSESSESISKTLNYSHEAERIKGQAVSDIRTAVLTADDFKLILSALQQVNGISIVSNPKIIVANQETATIHIGNNEPNIKGTVTPGQQGQANTTTYALDEKMPYFEYGISLDVTPTINNLSNISVRIAPTLSRFVQNKIAPDNNTYPVTSAKTIKTTFSLESGKTAAIGGLTETNDRDEVVKVPLLGDIPLIGKFFFTHTHKQHSQTETIIFVTVGLANSRTIDKEEGMPEGTVLAQKHMAALIKAKEEAAAAKTAKVEKIKKP